MPIKDPERRREAQKQQKRLKRAAEKRQKLSPNAAQADSVLGHQKRAQGVSAKDFDLQALAGGIMVESENLSKGGWLKLRGAIAIEMIALGRAALQRITIYNPKDALAVLEEGMTMLDQVLAVTGQLGGEEPDLEEKRKQHEFILSRPEGRQALQALGLLRSAYIQEQQKAG